MVERLKSSRTNDPSPVCGSSTDRCASEQAPFLQGASPVSVPTGNTATKVVLDKQGKVCGYIVCDKDDERCRTAQIGGQGDAVFSTILHYLAQRAVQLRREVISLSIAVHHPFARYCRPFRCRYQTTRPGFNATMERWGALSTCYLSSPRSCQCSPSAGGPQDRDRTLALRADIGTCALS